VRRPRALPVPTAERRTPKTFLDDDISFFFCSEPMADSVPSLAFVSLREIARRVRVVPKSCPNEFPAVSDDIIGVTGDVLPMVDDWKRRGGGGRGRGERGGGDMAEMHAEKALSDEEDLQVGDMATHLSQCSTKKAKTKQLSTVIIIGSKLWQNVSRAVQESGGVDQVHDRHHEVAIVVIRSRDPVCGRLKVIRGGERAPI
jgi:hypothetical protein